MKFHYAGKYNGDENSLPPREHPENYVPFKEAGTKTLPVVINILSIIIFIILLILVNILTEKSYRETAGLLGMIAPSLTLVPHEYLHAICFKKDVYMYNALKQGMLFVYGTEDMSKTRFIMMSLCPNIVFGFIPFIIFLIFPNLIFFGTFGALTIGMGAGDYYNIFNALTQVPKGAKIYMSGFHTFWYKQGELL